MLTQWFDPETGPAALPGVYAREFVAQGHKVRVLTGFPNYPAGVLYPGYRVRSRMSEPMAGVQVERVALYPDHTASPLRRTLNYLSFAGSAATLGAGVLSQADALWVYNSPVTVAVPLMVHSKLGRVPYFFHVQDVWPDSLIHSGMYAPGPTVLRMVNSLDALALSRAGAIGVISPSVKDLLLERHPRLAESSIHLVPNPTDEALFFPRQPDPELELASWRAPVTIMYLGAIGAVQGLDTVLDAAKLLLGRGEMRVVLVGDGIDRQRLQQRASTEGITNVTFLGRIAKEAVATYMASSDIQLVSLGSADFLRRTTPSKIATILASGLSVVGQIAGDGAGLINASGAGLVTTPGDAGALAGALSEVADIGGEKRSELGQAGRRYYLENLSAAAAVRTITVAMGGVPDGP